MGNSFLSWDHLITLASYNLYKDSNDIQRTSINDNTTTTMEKELVEESSEIPEDLFVILRRSQRTTKLSTWLQESLEYLNRPIANNVEGENWISKIFKETIRRLDLWWLQK